MGGPAQLDERLRALALFGRTVRVLPTGAQQGHPRQENDKSLLKAATRVMEDILRAAGADEVIAITRNAHLVGGARMGATENDGVVNADCRTFAVPNVYIVDGSVLPTRGSANPALTIKAVAARTPDAPTADMHKICLEKPGIAAFERAV